MSHRCSQAEKFVSGSLCLSWTHASNAPKQSSSHQAVLNIYMVPTPWLLEAYNLYNHHCCLEALYFHGQYDQNKVPSWLLGASWHFGCMPHQEQWGPAMDRHFPPVREGDPWGDRSGQKNAHHLCCSTVVSASSGRWLLIWGEICCLWSLEKNAAPERKHCQTVGMAELAELGLRPPSADGRLPGVGSSAGAGLDVAHSSTQQDELLFPEQAETRYRCSVRVPHGCLLSDRLCLLPQRGLSESTLCRFFWVADTGVPVQSLSHGNKPIACLLGVFHALCSFFKRSGSLPLSLSPSLNQNF